MDKVFNSKKKKELFMKECFIVKKNGVRDDDCRGCDIYTQCLRYSKSGRLNE